MDDGSRITTSTLARPLLIFCITRDRPNLLFNTLRSLILDSKRGAIQATAVIVIDDSCSCRNQEANLRTISETSCRKVFYHGKRAQRLFTGQFCHTAGVSEAILSSFVRQLGGVTWDLGAVRNYAALLAITMAERDSVIVMLDDDVALVSPQETNGQVCSSLATMHKVVARDAAAIVGGQLEGMPDISAIERELLECRRNLQLSPYKPPRLPVPVSGGLLAFSRSWVERLPFPRTYNEDWIWLMRCRALGAKLVKSRARGFHAWSPHVQIDKHRISREQFGEAFCEGWNYAFRRWKSPATVHRNLLQILYWAEILQDERRYLRRLAAMLTREANSCEGIEAYDRLKTAVTTLNYANSVVEGIQPENLARLSDNYIRSSEQWNKLLQPIAESSRHIRILWKVPT